MKNLDQKKYELEDTLQVMWDEITEEAFTFVATLAHLRRAEKDSVEHDEHWGELATALLELKLKSADAYKLMEKVEALEEQEVKT